MCKQYTFHLKGTTTTKKKRKNKQWFCYVFAYFVEYRIHLKTIHYVEYRLCVISKKICVTQSVDITNFLVKNHLIAAIFTVFYVTTILLLNFFNTILLLLFFFSFQFYFFLPFTHSKFMPLSILKYSLLLRVELFISFSYYIENELSEMMNVVIITRSDLITVWYAWTNKNFNFQYFS